MLSAPFPVQGSSVRITSILLLLPPLLLLAGCAERWSRPGATEAEGEAAQAQCAALASRQVPPAMVWTQVAAGYWVPPERRCRTTRDGDRDCVYRPGRYVPPRFDWVDVNAPARREARNACLVEGGWTFEGLRPLRL
jgi:hypothetical protein